MTKLNENFKYERLFEQAGVTNVSSCYRASVSIEFGTSSRTWNNTKCLRKRHNSQVDSTDCAPQKVYHSNSRVSHIVF